MESSDIFAVDTECKVATATLADTSPLRKARWWIGTALVLTLVFLISDSFVLPVLLENMNIEPYYDMWKYEYCIRVAESVVLNIFCIVGGSILMCTNNIYIRRSGRFLVIAALLSIVLFIFGIIDLLWSTSFASFIGNIYVNILRNLINYSLLLCAIVAFIYAGEVDIQQIYKISLIYIASFSWLTIWILINVHVDTYNETLYSMLSWISIAINGLLDFMLITAWWKLLSTAQPIVDHGDEPISRLFLNRGVVGFVATLIIMTAMLFLLANILIC